MIGKLPRKEVSQLQETVWGPASKRALESSSLHELLKEREDHFRVLGAKRLVQCLSVLEALKALLVGLQFLGSRLSVRV